MDQKGTGSFIQEWMMKNASQGNTMLTLWEYPTDL
jgi:hypothetical protein